MVIELDYDIRTGREFKSSSKAFSRICAFLSSLLHIVELCYYYFYHCTVLCIDLFSCKPVSVFIINLLTYLLIDWCVAFLYCGRQTGGL